MNRKEAVKLALELRADVKYWNTNLYTKEFYAYVTVEQEDDHADPIVVIECKAGALVYIDIYVNTQLLAEHEWYVKASANGSIRMVILR